MIKTYLLTAIGLIFFVFSLTAENGNNAIPIKQLADSCWKYMNRSDTIESKKLCMLLLARAMKTCDQQTLSNAYRTIANYYLITNNYDKSIEYYEKSINLSKSLLGKEGQLLYAECLLNYGLIFHNNGDYKSALEKYLVAEKIYYTYHDNFGIAESYNRMADIYMSLKKPEKGFEYNRKAYEFGIKANNKVMLAKIYLCYANNLSSQDSFEMANRYFMKVLNITKDIGITAIESVTYYDMASSLFIQKKYIEALPLFEKSYKIAHETGDKVNEYESLYRIGKTYYCLRNLPKAKQIITNVLSLAQHYGGLLGLQINALEALGNIEHESGNDKKAYEYSNRRIDKIYKTYSEDDQQQINFLNGKFQAQKREADINRLESEKKLQAEILQKRNNVITAIVALFLLTVFSAILLIRYYRQKQKLVKQQNEIQKHKILQLEQEKMLLATQSVLKGEENERKRLAQDLHDGLGGLLSGTKIALNNMKNNVVLTHESVKDFNHALGMLETSITELRRVAHNMMPDALLNLGLKDALNDFCTELDKIDPTHILFQSFGQFERIDSGLEINAYRIILELVNNALKHSGAKELVVQMIQEPGRLCFIVQDDGKGFDSKKVFAKGGLGLASVKSRVDLFNGRMEINSNSLKGTEITIEFTI
jgi:signal transduction histidine kinase